MIFNLIGVFILGTGFGALLAWMFIASRHRNKQWDRILYQIQHQVDGIRHDLDRLAARPVSQGLEKPIV